MILPAGFGSCSRCHRMLTVDGLNPGGRCTRDCGGDVGDRYRAAPRIAGGVFSRRLPETMLRDSDFYGDDGPLRSVALVPVDETEDDW